MPSPSVSCCIQGQSTGKNSMQSMLNAMTDPVIKYRFLTESGMDTQVAPLWCAYRYTDPVLPVMEAEMKGDEYTFHILNVALREQAGKYIILSLCSYDSCLLLYQMERTF